MTPQDRREQALRFLRVIAPVGGVVELRCLMGKKRTDAGYFDNLEAAVEAALVRDGGKPTGIYCTLNTIDPALLARAANRIKEWADKTTTDANVTRRRWLFLDLDPERVAGVSATEAEHAAALDRAESIRDALMADYGWHAPIVIDSGNGAYLLFPIDLPNDTEALKLIESTLAGLATLFNADGIKIDAAVGNAARILRLPGTLNRKGDSTDDRPHRYCRIVDVPDYLEIAWADPIDRAKLASVAALAPAKKGKQKSSGSTFKGPERRLLVDAWLSDRGVRFERKEGDGRTIFAMDCPFNPEHIGEANITQQASGALSSKCFHASCSGRGWEDFRNRIGMPERHHYDPPKADRKRKPARLTATPSNADILSDDSSDDDREPEIPGDSDDDRWTSIKHDEGRTPVAFARRFLRDYGDNVRYVPPWDEWLTWTGERWQRDCGRCAVTRMANAVADGVWAEVADYHTDDAVEFAQDMSSPSKWTSALKAAAAMRTAAVDELDQNPWLLNTTSGTVDLRTSELRQHDRGDMLTKICPTPYDPAATCPNWERFILEVFAGSQSLAGYVQRLAGWWLTGVIREHLLHVAYGIGANGKSTLFNTLLSVYGPDYGMQAVPELLVEKRSESHPTEKADLFGKRLVIATETEGGAKLAESTVKALTGGDKIRARRMRENFWEFDPTHKLVLLTNHKPRVRGTDHGIWRRLRLLPFNQVFDGDRADKTLPEKLTAEAPGILAWAVRGCLEWQRIGLQAPAEVTAATDQYRTSQDLFGRFAMERCVFGSSDYVAKFSELRAELERWCDDTGERAPSPKSFGQWLQDQGCEPIKANGRSYRGICLQA